MADIERRHTPAIFPDLFEWLSEPGPPLFGFAAARPFRVEEFTEDGTYVLRAELPGVDPDKDIDVTVEGGTLTIHAERREEHTEPHRCEFRHGSMTRSVTLPAWADTDHITASYDKGILEVTVPLAEANPEGRRVEITHS